MPAVAVASVVDAALWREAVAMGRNRSSSTTTQHESASEPLPPRLSSAHVGRVMREVDRACGCSGEVDADVVVGRYGEMLRDREQLRKLLTAPGIKQRTPEWYEARHTVVTASDIAQALGQGKFGTQRQFFEKKVAPLPTAAEAAAAGPSPFDTLAPLKWGQMLEDAAAAIYCARTGVALHEFGLLLHPSHPDVRVGASPDGISDAGVMVEIKCPYRRRINGEVPLQYYLQIQGQLEVCGLRHCDYLECEFTEYRNEQEFELDVLDDADGCTDVTEEEDEAFGWACNGREKGVIAEYVDGGNGITTYYKHAPLCPSRGAYRRWAHERRCVDDDAPRLKKIRYWRLETYSVIRVDKDDGLVPTMLRDLDDVWYRVTKYREDPSSLTPASTAVPTKPTDANTTQVDRRRQQKSPTSSASATAGTGEEGGAPPAAPEIENYAFVADDE